MRTKHQNIDLIKALSNANGVSGFEDEVAALAAEQIKEYCDCHEDSLRNLYFNLKKNTGGKPKVWLDAHSDEVGFIIQAIKPNGTMTFLPLGGWAANTIPSSKVRVRNDHGDYIPGIVAAKPVHFMSEQERQQATTIHEMVIDVGAIDREDLIQHYNISIAAPVVPDVECSYDESHEIFIGKAFDCRIGVAACIETLNQLKDKSLSVDIIGTLSVQEEVGERGTMAAVQMLDSDLAIIFEGCPADDTFYESYYIQSGLKKGPMLRHFDVSMITNPRFIRYALTIAKHQQIPFQEAVRSGGGTNAKFIHASRHGVPTIVIGIPVRYVHSHHGIAAYQDYQAAIQLAVAIIEDLTEATIHSF